MIKVPVDVTFHPAWWHKNAGINFNKDFFYDNDYRIEADIKMRKLLFEKFGDLGLGEKTPAPRPILGSDLIASGFLYSEILGAEVRYYDNNPPEVVSPKLNDDEVMKLKILDLDRSEIWLKIQKEINELINKYNYVISCLNLQGIQNIALDLRGMELFTDYYTNPELVHHLLKVCTDLSIEIGKRLKKISKNISAGVTAIVKQTVPDVYLTSNCTVEMVSLEIYNEFLLKYDNILASYFQPFGVHHCGKTMEHVVEGYAKIKNLSFAEVGAFSNIETVRKHLSKTYLNARYSPVKLKNAAFLEMKDDILRIFSDGKPLELLSISCVGIDDTTSDEKVRDFLNACREAEVGKL